MTQSAHTVKNSYGFFNLSYAWYKSLVYFKVHISNLVKFMFSKKATKIDEIFTIDLTLCSKCQIDGEDFVNFLGLLRKREL